MGRMLSSKALLPQAEAPAAAPLVPQASASRGPITLRPPAARSAIEDQSELQNPIRKIALYACLGFLFTRLTSISELLQFYTGFRFYLLYLFAPMAILGTLTTGGIARTFRQNASKYFLAFFVWMILATPFSFWKGDSVRLITDYGRTGIVMMFMLAGLAMKWSEIRLIFYTIAAAAVVSLAEARFVAKLDQEGRITMDASGNIGNSNDLGALILLVLPFIFYVTLDRKRNAAVRILTLPLIAYGFLTVLGTGSRGCLIAMAVMFLFVLWRAAPGIRVAALVAGVVLLLGAPFVVPSAMLQRLSSFGNNQRTAEGQEAEASSDTREYLLRMSLLYTAQHPLFGVGPGQFPNYEGKQKVEEGKRGAWKVTHNFLTQISSECGIPALIFVLLSLGSAMLLVTRTLREARARGFADIHNACFCFLLGFIGYLTSIIFLAQAYHFYLPTMVGLAISLSMVAAKQMSSSRTPSLTGYPRPLPVGGRLR